MQRLHACGLLRASFRPGREIAALRSYLRSRERHLDYAASHIQHMQKGGKVLSAHTRKTSNRLTVALRLAAVTVGRTNTALGAFYRRLAARIGNAKAVTATARKIAILFYNAMRFGIDYKDPGTDHYEQQYRDRVIKQLHRRAAQFGLILQQQNPAIDECVS
ncbi:hypothetical protein [Candidatus Nitrotoga sp. AM1P]|uniref:hypothetical protein n=1 Tax=Candidatus Nitrotoga sp. AM1P TaxID=2559597 RepID=UPI001F54BB7F|nr:hypothetical protein [Candidatus Nitrotoga sp. AM1P]